MMMILQREGNHKICKVRVTINYAAFMVVQSNRRNVGK